MRHCLVVDDSSVIRKVARRILEDFDFTVTEAEDGGAALNECQRSMPNLILLANAAVPRGGTVKVTVESSAPPRFVLRSSGPSARVPSAFENLVPGNITDAPVDAQSVQAYYTGALARVSAMNIQARLDGADVVVEAVPAG